MNSEDLRGREVDNQLELRRLEHWQVGRPFAVEDAGYIDGGLTESFVETSTVTRGSAVVDIEPGRIDRRDFGARRARICCPNTRPRVGSVLTTSALTFA